MKKITPVSLGLLLMFIYFVSYVTRLSYSSVIVEMTSVTGLSKTQLSAAVTASFFSYAVGQIISGMLGDRIHPKKLIAGGIAAAILTNLAIPFCRIPALLAVIWGVNGMAQAFMWPPMVKLMTHHLSPEGYSHAAAIVSYGSSLGTVAVYLAAPAIISLLTDYRAVFAFSAIVGAIALPIWLRLCPSDKISSGKPSETGEGKKSPISRIITPALLMVMLSIAFQGFIRDGITTWMPTFISESFDLGSSVSILSGVIIPIFCILCVRISELVYSKWLKDPLICAAFFFAVSAASCALLIAAGGLNPIIAIISMGMICGSIYGVNFALISILPGKYSEYGCASTASGMLNACTYVGSTLSSFGIAAVSEKAGWGAAELMWLICAILGGVICFGFGKSGISIFPKKRKTTERNGNWQ